MDIPIHTAKDRFEEKGIELQINSTSIKKAVENFNGSCIRCTLYHRNANCDCCPIREAFLGGVKMHGYPTKDYPWVENEMALE